MERWYRFSAGDRKPLYGHGAMDQALEYADRLKRRHNAICTTSAYRTRRRRSSGWMTTPRRSLWRKRWRIEPSPPPPAAASSVGTRCRGGC
jgi:hypothetical protein